jgi:2-methylcitrate dehydratase PrpD
MAKVSRLPLDDIARFVTRFSLGSVDPAIVDRAKLTTLDTMACMVAGSRDPVVHKVAQMTAEGATGSIVGTPLRSSTAGAAFVNGVSGAWLQLDETHFKMKQHPAIHVIPVALAVAEQVNSSAEELLAAVVCGYEVGARFGRASSLRWEVHPHGTHGLVGGVVAAAVLMRLDFEGVKRAVRLALSTLTASASIARDEGADVFNTYCGLADERAVSLTTLAAAGIDGARDATTRSLSHVLGWDLDFGSISRGLGEEFVIGSNFIKDYPCCADLHAAITGVLEIRNRERVAPSDIAEVHVVAHEAACEITEVHPDSSLLARFSLPYVVSVCLVLGYPQDEAFAAGSRSNPAIRRLAERTRVEPGERQSRAFPERLQSQVTITTTDGRSFETSVDLSHDSARWPNERERVVRKAQRLLSLAMPEHRVTETIDLVLGPDEGYRVRELISMTTGAGD